MLSDYGDTSAFPELAAVVRSAGRPTFRHNHSTQRSTRTSTGDANAVLRMLVKERHGDPGALLTHGSSPNLLLNAKAEVDASFARARRAAPQSAGNVALIQIHEECQVHPLIAQTRHPAAKADRHLCERYLLGSGNSSPARQQAANSSSSFGRRNARQRDSPAQAAEKAKSHAPRNNLKYSTPWILK